MKEPISTKGTKTINYIGFNHFGNQIYDNVSGKKI